jgi:hypothetical protein
MKQATSLATFPKVLFDTQKKKSLKYCPRAGMVLSMNALLTAKEVFNERNTNAEKRHRQ